MVKKLKSRSGMTLTELLITMLILTLFSSACLLGITTALSVRRDMIKAADADILASSASQAIADEIRMSTGAKPSSDNSRLEYGSLLYGSNCTLELVTDSSDKYFGQVVVSGTPLLSSAAYGHSDNSASSSDLHLWDLKIASDGDVIRVEFDVCDTYDNVLVHADFTVAPINPANTTP